MVTLSPLGIPGTYFEIGSSSETFPASICCMTIVPVYILVSDPIRTCMSVVIGALVVGSASPYAWVQVPCGVRTATIAPGVAASAKPA